MNRYIASYTVTRTRTIVETATITEVVEAEGFADAGEQAEGSDPDFSSASFTTLSDDSQVTPGGLSSIAFDGVIPEPAAPVAADDLSGLTPARYDSSPAPSGRPYFPVQVEPTPND